MTKQAFEEYDEDRKRLARELHGSALQDLAALRLNLSLVSTKPLSPREAKALADCEALAQSCARAVRATCDRLYPALLEEAGLLPTIRAFASETGAAVSPDSSEQIGRISRAIAIGAFRIVEETVLNAESRSNVQILVRKTRGALLISISGASSRGSVRERVRALGGRLSFLQSGGTGSLRVTLPLTTGES